LSILPPQRGVGETSETSVVGRIKGFLSRQSHNYRMMLVRSAGANFLYNLTGQYTSIYVKALGADNIMLGAMSSLSAFISMLISLPVGYITDRYNLRKVLGAGMLLNIVMIALYAFAEDWRWVVVAMAINPLTMALMFRSQQVMVINGLKVKDRATGMGLRMQAAMAAGLVAPLFAAMAVNRFGGLTLEGIRPLFKARLVGLIILYAYVYLRTQDEAPAPREEASGGFVSDFREVLEGGGRKLWVMILVGVLGAFVWSTLENFAFLYAAEVKGATSVQLGLMPTFETIATLVFSTPLNRLADTRGRKHAFILVRPLLWLGFAIAILAPDPRWLIASWFLRGVALSTSAYQTLLLELVPPEQRGRWLGLSNTFSAMARVAAPLVGGLLYDSAFPWLVFAFPLAIDMLIRIPILHLWVPETGEAQQRV